jgi:hypothetical protein
VLSRTLLESRPLHAFLKAALRAGHDRLIHLFCPCPNSLPAVEPAHPCVSRMRIVSPAADVCDGGGTCTKDIVCIGASERDEVCRQDLGHAAYASGDDEQPRTRSLDERNPTRLGQGRVQEDVPAYKDLSEGQPASSSRKFAAYIAHVGRSDGAEELDTVLQQVLFPHLKDVDELRAVTACTFVSSGILGTCSQSDQYRQ